MTITSPQVSTQSVGIRQFSKDHWSLLLMVALLCVEGNGIGTIKPQTMRCDPDRHPLLSCNNPWKPEYGTRLQSFFDEGKEKNADVDAMIEQGHLLTEHDDWDCLNDLEEAGLVEIISLVNYTVRITQKGFTLSHLINQHKLNAGKLNNFSLPDTFA